ALSFASVILALHPLSSFNCIYHYSNTLQRLILQRYPNVYKRMFYNVSTIKAKKKPSEWDG
ncbi:TPA: hypothetical protein ACGOTW_000960, partial [Streptococcus suis]